MYNIFKIWLVPIKMINILQFDRWDFNKLGSHRISDTLLFVAMDKTNLMTHFSSWNSPVASYCNQNKYINLRSVWQGIVLSNWCLHLWSPFFPLSHSIITCHSHWCLLYPFNMLRSFTLWFLHFGLFFYSSFPNFASSFRSPERPSLTTMPKATPLYSSFPMLFFVTLPNSFIL